MARCNRTVLLLTAAVAILLVPFADNLFAQDPESAMQYKPGPGGYFSWWKILLIAAVFIFWVRMADWANRDSMKIGERMSMQPEFWNPMIAFPFLAGFILVISLPIFVAGLPIYLITAFMPVTVYFFIRRSRFKQNPNIKQYLKLKPGEAPAAETLPQDEGAFIDFTPAGDDSNQKQGNLIRARQSDGFTSFKELLALTQFKRAEQLQMEFTREGVSLRILVDGSWHPLDPMDRESGDAILSSMKNLAGLNAAERRAPQTGSFRFKSDSGKAAITVTSRGVATGERVLMKYELSAKEALPFPQLGMFPDMVSQIKDSLNQNGTTIISAPPGCGLTSSWQGALVTADRLTRDCVGVIDQDEIETVQENIVIHRYEEGTEKSQFPILKTLLLTQPDMLAVPKLETTETFDLLMNQVLTQQRSVLLRVPAKSAAEALLKMYKQAGDRDQFLKATKNVTCQRLVRRLCTDCRVEVRVQPKTIQQLGGNPKTQGTIYNQWRLPPPDQRVDDKGRPIEYPPCTTCGGLGFIGRIAVFEMLSLNDQLRTLIKQSPKITTVEAAAVKLGKTTITKEAYKLVLLGVTSLAEAQRILKQQ
ncbi:ATPase, T2SS/T4P/T4SS family [Mariniblastus sp.]|jgi:type II secretory ATPase GspE/PulE/Tfp pilus assembly ATPase PilB-like protein|nr:ATPase, T2SS/T4P/T4SS family [Mariniblastus sp.]